MIQMKKTKVYRWVPPKELWPKIEYLAEKAKKTPSELVEDLIEKAWRQYLDENEKP